MNETEFPALGQKRTGDYGISISSGRAPNSPSQAPSRPQSISDHQVTSLTRDTSPQNSRLYLYHENLNVNKIRFLG